MINTRTEFAALSDDWAGLLSDQIQPSPFMGVVWIDTFWEVMPLSGWKVFVLSAWNDNELIGAAPLMMKEKRFCGLKYKQFNGLENVHTEIYSWLLPSDTDQAERIVHLFIDKLKTLAGDASFGLHMITWGNMQLDHPVSKTICNALKTSAYHLSSRRPRYAPFTTFSDKKDFFSSLRQSLRSRIKNRWNRLCKMGKVQFEEASSSPRLKDHLKQIWEIEANTWKSNTKTAVVQSPHLMEFYNSLALRLAPSGKFTLFLLWCNDRLVAFQYCLIDNRMIHLLKLSFDNAYARTSPSYLLTWKICEWAEKKGFAGFDLGGKADEWKLHWTSQTKEFNTLFSFSPGFIGFIMYLAKFGWKDLLKKVPLAATIKRLSDIKKQHSRRYSAKK